MDEKIRIEHMKGMAFLCNYESGAVAYLEPENENVIRQALETGNWESLPPDMKNCLDACDFLGRGEAPYRQSYVHVTDRCNMNCAGCYSRTSERNRRPDLTLLQLEAIFGELEQHGVRRVILSGGEPLLRDDLAELIAMARQHGFGVEVVSNGSIAISDDVLTGLDVLHLSMDFLDRDTNAVNRNIFRERILRNVARAQALSVPVCGIITVTSRNEGQLEDYFAMSAAYQIPISFSLFYSDEEGCRSLLLNESQQRDLALTCAENLGGLVEGISAYDEIFCRDSCAACRESISVDAAGNLCPCHMLQRYNLGSLLTSPETAWERLDVFANAMEIPQECRACEYRMLCGAGCKARSLTAGTVDPYCAMYRAHYEKQVEYIRQQVGA
ncbi:MAG: radical SAM protein [Lachnospiraceae bacterium]|nr:radical SAM protein [Lachnospiraceae bacterium]